MIKENERITYEEFMTMFKFAPRMCYTLYDRAENEIENLQKKVEQGDHYKHLYSEVKKQKDDVVEYIKHKMSIKENYMIYGDIGTEILRMLGEIDE